MSKFEAIKLANEAFYQLSKARRQLNECDAYFRGLYERLDWLESGLKDIRNRSFVSKDGQIMVRQPHNDAPEPLKEFIDGFTK